EGAVSARARLRRVRFRGRRDAERRRSHQTQRHHRGSGAHPALDAARRTMNAVPAWKNWSGSVQAQPSRLASPRTEDELAAIVRGAAKVRVVGAGGFLMPLWVATGVV